MISQRRIESNPKKIKVILEMKPSMFIQEIHHLTGIIIYLNRFSSKFVDRYLLFFETLKKASQFSWTSECRAFEELEVYFSTSPLLVLSMRCQSPKPIPYHFRYCLGGCVSKGRRLSSKISVLCKKSIPRLKEKLHQGREVSLFSLDGG